MLHRVLIVEDELELSNILSKYLNKRNFDVECTDTIRDGIDKLSKESFHYIILDNNLPDGKGLEHINEFRYLQPDLIIIAISALQVKDVALKAGANYFIEKPISLKAIERILSLEHAA
jgi:DNA-binding response OmpR family regulator